MTHPFTETYIKMAKAAEEIQAMRYDPESFQLGEWYLSDYGVELLDRSTLCFDRRPAWLPRLDQLLGMLEGPCAFVHAVAHAGDGPGIYFHNEQDETRDWHELAMAVVMREMYGKKWDGKGWVKV